MTNFVFQNCCILCMLDKVSEKRLFLSFRLNESVNFLPAPLQSPLHERFDELVHDIARRFDFVRPEFRQRPLGAEVKTHC